jgi:hypothetical protein
MDSAIGAMLVLAFLALWWHSAIRARDQARELARRFCERQGWQLLDQTVALASLRPRRIDNGLRWRRIYRFDFSPDGGNRRGGQLTLLGNRLESISAELEDGSSLIERTKST